MFFKRAVQRYGQSPEPITPYQKAEQVWDRRMGTLAVQAANWRLMAMGASLIALTLAGGMTWLASQSRVTPYVVEVDRFGAVQAVQPAVNDYKPTDAQIAWFLSRFVTDVRSLPTDPILVRQNWLEAYAFTAGNAVTFLNSQAQANDPFAGIAAALRDRGRRRCRNGELPDCRPLLRARPPFPVGRTPAWRQASGRCQNRPVGRRS